MRFLIIYYQCFESKLTKIEAKIINYLRLSFLPVSKMFEIMCFLLF